MATAEETLMDWLRDAHAMEQQAEQMLSAQSSRIEHYPELSACIEQHRRETQSQAERISQCIARRGGDTSAIKDLSGRAMAMMQGMGGMFASDEVVKGSMASYAFEHMEVCAYRILITAAEAVGDRETARVCTEICAEEEAMAAWLAEHIPGLTREYLAREEQELAEAKR